MPPVTILVQNDLVTPEPVEGIVVEFYNTGGVFQTSGTTDVDGEVEVTLPLAFYDLMFYKPGVSILPKQPQRIEVIDDDPNSFTVSCHERTLPEASDPDLCRITGYIVRGDGDKIVTKLVFQTELELLVIGEDVVAPESRIEVASDANGYFDFLLLRGVEYRGYFLYQEVLFGINPGRLKILVPDAPALEVDRLLFPLPENTDFSANTITLLAGAEPDDSIEVVTLYSDGSERTENPPWSYIKASSSDDAVVEAAISYGKLVLTPKTSGTATVSVERVISSRALWTQPPEYVSETVLVTVS